MSFFLYSLSFVFCRCCCKSFDKNFKMIFFCCCMKHLFIVSVRGGMMEFPEDCEVGNECRHNRKYYVHVICSSGFFFLLLGHQLKRIKHVDLYGSFESIASASTFFDSSIQCITLLKEASLSSFFFFFSISMFERVSASI